MKSHPSNMEVGQSVGSIHSRGALAGLGNALNFNQAASVVPS